MLIPKNRFFCAPELAALLFSTVFILTLSPSCALQDALSGGDDEREDAHASTPDAGFGPEDASTADSGAKDAGEQEDVSIQDSGHADTAPTDSGYPNIDELDTRAPDVEYPGADIDDFDSTDAEGPAPDVQDPSPGDIPPTIEISASRASPLAPRESTTLTATVTPADSQVIWEKTGGGLSSGSGTRVEWSAADPGAYTITATATSGEGSASAEIDIVIEDPCSEITDCHLIRTLDDLELIRENLDGHHILISDIDASSTKDWVGDCTHPESDEIRIEEGFEPIGDEDNPFTGIIDGNNYHIRDLSICYVGKIERETKAGEYTNQTSSQVGLFGQLSGASIKDLGLEDIDITGGHIVGGLAGRSENSSIDNIYITGRLHSTGKEKGLTQYSSIGGLIGEVKRISTTSTVPQAQSILNSYNNADIRVAPGSEQSIRTGGLVGYIYGVGPSNIKIENSYHHADIIGHKPNTPGHSYATGGLVGSISLQMFNSDEASAPISFIESSYSLGSVKGDNITGGLVGSLLVTGQFSSASIKDSYSHAEVNGEEQVGGLIGLMDSQSVPGQASGTCKIKRTYSVGEVEGTDNIGGLVGHKDPNSIVEKSYWREDASDEDISIGIDKPAAAMKQTATYTDWDFDEVWSIDEGNDYPDLRSNPR